MQFRRILDLTHPLRDGGPAYPGDPAPRVRAHATLEADGYRLAELTLGSHAGTHVDAPSHYLAEGGTVDALPLSALIGPATAIDVPGEPGTLVGPEILSPHEAAFRPGARVLLRSGWDARYGREDYWHDYPGLSPAAARWIVERQIALVGFDAPGPSPQPEAVHRILLGATPPVVIVESLANLSALPREFTLIVLPLRLAGLDGAPARAVAVIEE